MTDKLLSTWETIYNYAGDRRTKNIAMLVLTMLTLFGMIAPDTATTLRNAVLGLM